MYQAPGHQDQIFDLAERFDIDEPLFANLARHRRVPCRPKLVSGLNCSNAHV